MNFLFIILSIFFSTVTPSNFSNEGTSGNNNHVNVKKATEDGGKKDKMGGNGDFIITSDDHP